MRIFIIIFTLSIFLYSETIEPLKSKKALIYAPFQQDFKTNFNKIVTELKKNYKVDIVSSAKIGNHKVIDITPSVYYNYLLKLNNYDLIIFNTHSSPDSISTGIPYLKKPCSEVYNKDECKSYTFLNLKARLRPSVSSNSGTHTSNEKRLIDNAHTFTIKENIYYKSFSLRTDFFKQFIDEKSLENSIIILDGCESYGSIEKVLREKAKVAVTISWKNKIGGGSTPNESTIPFLEQLASGKTFKSILKEKSLKSTFDSKIIYPKITYSSFLKQKNNDIVLFDKNSYIYLISDMNWFLKSTDYVGRPNNTKLFFNLINATKGKHSQFNKIQFYDGHGTGFPDAYEGKSIQYIKEVARNKGYYIDSYRTEKPILTDGYRAIFIIMPGRNSSGLEDLFFEEEIKKLKEFTLNGGVLILITEYNQVGINPFMQYLHTYNILLEDLGIEVEAVKSYYKDSIDTDKGKIYSDSVLEGVYWIYLQAFSNFNILDKLNENKVLFSYEDKPVFIKSKIN